MITVKQRMFADEYIRTGNATKSYMFAYECSEKNARPNASRMLTKDNVKLYIKSVSEALQGPKIATMEEIKEFWSNTLGDKELDYKHRLKASEYLAKTSGAFIDKIDHSGNIGVALDVSRLSDKQIDELLKKVNE